MKYKALILLLLPLFTFAQSRVVLNNDPYLVLNNGTSGTPVYFVIDNPATNAVTLAGTGGNIISEAEFNMVKWNIGTSTGTYTIPFTKSFSGPKIPLSITISGAGTGAGNIKFSTYTGANWNNSIYKPSDVTATFDLATGTLNNSAFVIDRFWIIDANGYSSNNTRPSLSPVSFTYVDAEWSAAGNTISEGNLFAQRFNSSLNKWADWLGTPGTDNAAANTVNSGSVSGANFFRSWTLSDISSPLPVQLISFEGNCYAGKVLLTWSTATETNNDHFTVERTFDGYHYETVALVPGAGNSSFQHQYSVADENAFSGTAYYRLRQTDFNGNSTTYGLITVQGCDDLATDSIINAFDNGGELVVWLSEANAGNNTVTVFNVIGQQLVQSQNYFSKGFNEVRFPVPASSGIYIVTVSSGKGILSRKVKIAH